MPEITDAEAALLGLVAEGLRYPYEIEQQVKNRDMRFWTELSMSSIYKLLAKLELKGFVISSTEISPENRLRKIYGLTPAGQTALHKKIEALLSQTEHVRWPLDIGTYNSSLLPPERVRAALEKYRREIQEKIKGYEELLRFLHDSGCLPHRQAVAARPIYLLKAEEEWVKSFLDGMEN